LHLKIKFTNKLAEVFLIFFIALSIIDNIINLTSWLNPLRILFILFQVCLVYLYVIKSARLEIGLKVWAFVMVFSSGLTMITFLLRSGFEALDSTKFLTGVLGFILGLLIYFLADEYIEPYVQPIEHKHLIEDE